jgi:hypothetical protein
MLFGSVPWQWPTNLIPEATFLRKGKYIRVNKQFVLEEAGAEKYKCKKLSSFLPSKFKGR